MAHGGDHTWTLYDAWNEAILDVVFPELDEPRPVYVDFEDEVVEQLAERMGLDRDKAEAALCATVAGTLASGGPAAIFARHMARTRTWRRAGRKGTPPFLALLSAFCIAAERMASGDGMAPSNYFGRLRQVLGRAPDDRHVELAYRRVAEPLWGTLNGWLLDLDGRRGLPTAYSLSHRYVGLTVSQALVRKADRDKFNEFFRQFGFAPGSEVAPHELAQLLDGWLSQTPSPVSKALQGLWVRGQARDRIAQVAAVALAGWDGSVPERGTTADRATGHLALALEIGGFPSKRMSVQALLYLAQASKPRDATILTTEPPQTVEVVPAVQGAVGLGRSAELHPEDVLEGVLRIKDSLTGAVLERRPRRLVLFRQDDITRRWIESPQVLLGDHVTLLAREDLVPRLEQVLTKIARPGWEVRRAAYRGQPDRWAVITDVEVFSHPGELVRTTGMDDLAPLIPLTTSQLRVAGGFAIPGAIRGKWHSWRPPEVRAVSDAPAGFQVRVVELMGWDDEGQEEETTLECVSDNGTGVVVLPLADLELEDGDYRIELVDAATKEVLTATTVRLRSGDTPDARQWANAQKVGYATESALGFLGVPETDGPVTRGLCVPVGPDDLWGRVAPPQTVWWGTSSPTRRGQSPVTALRLTMPDPTSCIYTGRHREQIETVPTDSMGKPLVAWSRGRCSGCGLERRFPTRIKPGWGHRRTSKRTDPPVRTHDVGELPPSPSSDEALDWETAFDALLHAGGGTWAQFERVAFQLEPTALFVDQLARSLEALGHLDVRRDPRTLEPVAWEVAPTALADTSSGQFFAGHWPGSLFRTVGEAVEASGGHILQEEQATGPSSYFAVMTSDVAELVSRASVEVTAAGHAWRRLAASLPRLSDVAEALPRHEASLSGSITWYSPRENKWLPATDSAAVGGYRFSRFSTTDVIRTERDLANGTLARSTVQLSKHIAALLTAEPLLAYRPDAMELVVPLGADLPGIYGRAVVACSGRLPFADLARRVLVYHDVPPELANHLSRLLGS